MKSSAHLSLKGRALAALSRREHSRSELMRKLVPYADNVEQVVSLLDGLADSGFLSEARFVESVVRRRAPRMGVQRVRQELRQHQLPDELINDACAELKEDEAQRLFALWMRRFGEKPATPQEQARQMRFFHGRGFSSDSIRHLFRQVSQLSQTECADNGD